MPYTRVPRTEDGVPVDAGVWVPELDRPGWEHRGAGQPQRWMWAEDRPVSRGELEVLAGPAVPGRDALLSLLGADAASIQRDGFLYTNFLERLKQNPDDRTADQIVDDMKELGFASVSWPADLGGPPPRGSRRSVKKVLNWLFGLLAQVLKALRKVADVLMAVFSLDGVTAISLGVLPPQLGFEISSAVFRDPASWDAMHNFMDKLQAELAAAVFG